MNISYGVKTYDNGFRPMIILNQLEYVSIHIFETAEAANDFAYKAYCDVFEETHAELMSADFTWQEFLET